MLTRVFLATWLLKDNVDRYERLVEELRREHRLAIRPVPPASHHLTWGFTLVPPDVVPELATSLGRCVADLLDIRLGRPRVLFARRQPRLVSVPIVAPIQRARKLQMLLIENVSTIGGNPIAWSCKMPHATLARFGRTASERDGRMVESAIESGGAGLERADFVREVCIVESVLTPSGPVYTTRGRAALRG